MTERCGIPFAVCVFLAVSACASAEDGSVFSPTDAPPIEMARIARTNDLGTWDDVFVCRDSDDLIVRRGDSLFSLSMTLTPVPKELPGTTGIAASEMVCGIRRQERFWVFCRSTASAPFALDVNTGTKVTFDIPGLKLPRNHGEEVQSWVMAPHADAVVLMIAGGSRYYWPMAGNHPIYFMFHIQSGKVHQFPEGWDLDFLSADQSVAVFATPGTVRFQGRPLKGVDLRTGEYMDVIPDRTKDHWVPFNWTYKDNARPLLKRLEPTRGHTEDFAGISADGVVCPFDLALAQQVYLASTDTRGGWTTFRLRRNGGSDWEACHGWISPLQKGAAPLLLGTNVSASALLGDGLCVYVTSGQGAQQSSAETFVCDAGTRRTWNILEGVERLPPLSDKVLAKPYVRDMMSVRLVGGLGDANPVGRQRNPGLALCLFTHVRSDERALAIGQNGMLTKPDPERIGHVTWRRAFVVTSNGRRFLVDGLRDDVSPDPIWFHNSGILVLGRYVWSRGEPGERRRIQLQSVRIGLGEVDAEAPSSSQ